MTQRRPSRQVEQSSTLPDSLSSHIEQSDRGVFVLRIGLSYDLAMRAIVDHNDVMAIAKSLSNAEELV